LSREKMAALGFKRATPTYKGSSNPFGSDPGVRDWLDYNLNGNSGIWGPSGRAAIIDDVPTPDGRRTKLIYDKNTPMGYIDQATAPPGAINYGLMPHETLMDVGREPQWLDVNEDGQLTHDPMRWAVNISSASWKIDLPKWARESYICKECGKLSNRLASWGKWGCTMTVGITVGRTNFQIIPSKKRYDYEVNGPGTFEYKVLADHIPPHLDSWRVVKPVVISMDVLKHLPSSLQPVPSSRQVIGPGGEGGPSASVASFVTSMGRRSTASEFSSSSMQSTIDPQTGSVGAVSKVKDGVQVFPYDWRTMAAVSKIAGKCATKSEALDMIKRSGYQTGYMAAGLTSNLFAPIISRELF
jgi:hypothetical protein